MTTFAPPRRHASSLLHRHPSNSMSRVDSPPFPNEPSIFEGTDTVTQNRKTAVQRIVEVHDALELKRHAEKDTVPRGINSASSSDLLGLEFKALRLPDGEVRTFKYFLRIWDHHSACPDPELEEEIRETRLEFEVAAIKHFMRRIALWHEDLEVMQAARQEMERKHRKNKKESESILGSLWTKERSKQENSLHDELKQVTTREGLAQLLWTLMHDQTGPLAPELFAECTEAVKFKYGITS
ncbi:hypothetical protein GQ44DRAFT_703206 [Phaeosphaeriaceae sp. PMI808]|nr:hypothetical protein GQ44DRAFT_703206 [Phaeosphaeriaceae sp. PMI808]